MSLESSCAVQSCRPEEDEQVHRALEEARHQSQGEDSLVYWPCLSDGSSRVVKKELIRALTLEYLYEGRSRA